MITTIGWRIDGQPRYALEGSVFVGGAVVTPEYAKRIGADYYARDAKASVEIAREVFGQ